MALQPVPELAEEPVAAALVLVWFPLEPGVEAEQALVAEVVQRRRAFQARILRMDQNHRRPKQQPQYSLQLSHPL